jgi:hypothetical protein
MIPSKALREKMATLLGADTATLAPAANANVIALFMNDISPTEATVLGDLVLSTFDGNAPLEVGLNAQPVALDPANNDAIIDMVPPITGFRWVTSGVTNLPQTIYGYALLTHLNAAYLAAKRLDTPVVLTAVGQRVDIGAPNFRQLANSVS